MVHLNLKSKLTKYFDAKSFMNLLTKYTCKIPTKLVNIL